MHVDDYKIAIICALAVELAAVCALLDETHEPLDQRQSDSNVYTLGRIGRHNVVIACLSAIGLAPTAVVATNLQSSFPNAKLGLLIGIGGGIPSEQHDIRLGDVVVSHPTDMNGGIVQYDFGKTEQGAHFRQFGHVNSPPDILLKAIKTLESDSILGKRRIQSVMSEITSRDPGNHMFQKPEKDELFQSVYDHHTGESTCASCDKSQLVLRESRLTSAPIVHYGTIASGNQVIKHGPTRDRLGRTFGALCIEMEAAGLIRSFPSLIIRGICDYADSHKNKDWQPYAAFSAAAYAKELLDRVPVHKAKTNRIFLMARSGNETHSQQGMHNLSLNERVKSGSSDKWSVERFKSNPMDERSVERYRDTHSWRSLLPSICDYDGAQAHYFLSRGRFKGTTEWFLDEPIVEKWLESPSCPSLWFSGGSKSILHSYILYEGSSDVQKVGSGKTMICTMLIDHLQNSIQHTREHLVFFYCESSVQKTVQATYLVRSLVRQLLDRLVKLGQDPPQTIRDRINYLFSPTGLEPDLKDMTFLFETLYMSAPRVYYIIDGLDEIAAEELAPLVKIFNGLKYLSNQKLFIATRDELGLNIRPNLTTSIQLSSSKTKKDLERYIEMRVNQKMDERTITEDPLVLRQVKERLIEEARGMFLWAYLQIEALWLDCFNDEQILSSLDNIPQGLNETYDRCVARIFQQPNIAAKALRWLGCARRPLSVQELQEAVSYTLADSEWSRRKITPKDTILSACANLIILDEEFGTVRLVHSSVRQYLFRMNFTGLSEFITDKAQADLCCGEECLNYLAFSDFKLQLASSSYTKVPVPSPHDILHRIPFAKFAAPLRGLSPSPRLSRSEHISISASTPLQIKEQKYKFLDYARENWAFHTKMISKTSAKWYQFKELALQANSSWNFHPWTSSGASLSSQLHGMLIWTSREGHIPLLKLLLEESGRFKVEQFCNIPYAKDGLPALHIAARQGFMDVISLLMKICDINSLDGELRTALHHCAEKNHWQILEKILSSRSLKVSSVSLISESGESALGIASGLGHKNIVDSLISANAGLNPEEDAMRNPINAAARNGHYEVLENILRRYGKSPLAKGIYRNALLQAVQNGHESVTRLLLNSYQFIDTSADEDGQTPLSWAARHGHDSVVKLLLKHTDVNSRDKNGRTPLSWAAGQGREGIVEMLLEHEGVDTTTLDKNGRTPLSWAAENGHKLAVKLLLERIYVNFSDVWNRTPLFWAAQNGHDSVVKLLLEHKDIDINIWDISSLPLVFCAELNGHESTVKLLLGSMNVNTLYAGGWTLLIWAAHQSYSVVARLLLERPDVDPNTRDSDGRTALSWAAGNGYDLVVEPLLARKDIDTNSRDTHGRTPLSWAAGNGAMRVVRILLEHKDVDPDMMDKGGWRPLEWARKNQRDAVVGLLMSYQNNRLLDG